MEKCSCEEAVFLRRALHHVMHLANVDTRQTQYADLVDISRVVLEALSALEPGGEPRCSCDEAMHYRAALRACLLLSIDGEGRVSGQPIEDVAQCNNVAHQGLTFERIEGDPGVYDARRYITQL